MESRLDSTPVLEGSILAWRSESMGSFRFDERVNADDAQIGMHSIKVDIDQLLTHESLSRTSTITKGRSRICRRAQDCQLRN